MQTHDWATALRPPEAVDVRKVAILVGTMTGTADLVAAEVETALQGAGFEVTVALMDGLDASALNGAAVYLICTSTYGNGDVPDNGQALFADLEEKRPDLSGVAFGLIALGDQTYKATFCQGGLRFDALLRELGAKRLGDPLLHDAGGGTLPEDVAAEWVLQWAADEAAHLADVA
jgi:MioC protein